MVIKFVGSEGFVEKVMIIDGEYEVDFVILCVGFCLNIDLVKG